MESLLIPVRQKTDEYAVLFLSSMDAIVLRNPSGLRYYWGRRMTDGGWLFLPLPKDEGCLILIVTPLYYFEIVVSSVIIQLWRVGGAVTQRSAKPFRRVRLPYVPPYARMAELVDARDLKSLDFTVVRVRFPLCAPEIILGV